MDNILVPIDFSETSSNALEVAAKIAKDKNANITVLHMLGLSEAVLTKNEAHEFIEAKYYMKLAKKRFSTFLDKPYLKGVTVKQIVQNYKLFNELDNICQEHKIDLIVMGSHGTKGVSELFVGSNTEKVVRTSNTPVLVIKEQNPDFKIKKIIFACNFKNDAVLAYKKALNFAQEFSAQLIPIYINTPYNDFMSTSEIEKRISDFMFKAGGNNAKVLIYNDYSVELGLFNYSKKEKIDILGIPTHGRKGLSHFFMGSIGEDVANHANLPVITFKI